MLLGAIIFMLIYPLINGVKSLDPLQSVQKMNAGKSLVLDIREEHEYQRGHIINSQHIPLAKLPEKIKELEKYKDQSIIVACQTGNRSTHACKTLTKAGFTDVYNLRGGMLAWSNDNLPINKG